MKCPHCQTQYHDRTEVMSLGADSDGLWYMENQKCPACNRLILQLVRKKFLNTHLPPVETDRYLARPRTPLRPLPSEHVPAEFSEDYIEASLILTDSPKASAALSRRCLQHVLREKAGVKHSSLAKEIDQVLDSGKLPSHLADAIDAIRNIGNFAAHPIKSTSTGEILPVEPGEPEWNLDVLDGLFDFYFVQPVTLKERRAALDTKLASAGKPPVKAQG
jgi:hypothetical protein